MPIITVITFLAWISSINFWREDSIGMTREIGVLYDILRHFHLFTDVNGDTIPDLIAWGSPNGGLDYILGASLPPLPTQKPTPSNTNLQSSSSRLAYIPMFTTNLGLSLLFSLGWLHRHSLELWHSNINKTRNAFFINSICNQHYLLNSRALYS
jgi:hypothetical protein